MRPLAERMRPETLDDVVGQLHLIGTQKIIREIIDFTTKDTVLCWVAPSCIEL